MPLTILLPLFLLCYFENAGQPPDNRITYDKSPVNSSKQVQEDRLTNSLFFCPSHVTCSVLQWVRAWSPILNCFFCSFYIVFGLFKVSLRWPTLLTFDAFARRRALNIEFFSHGWACIRIRSVPQKRYNSLFVRSRHVMWSTSHPSIGEANHVPYLQPTVCFMPGVIVTHDAICLYKIRFCSV